MSSEEAISSASEDDLRDQSPGSEEEERSEQEEVDESADSSDQREDEDTASLAKEQRRKAKRQREAQKFKEDQENRGIIYISKVPPFMKPEKVRHLMGQYGEVDRIYLTPESETRRKARIRRGGTKKICYIDGWVEFHDKRVAKRVAISLNNTPVGGSKRSFHAEFTWNIRYLSKFKWQHLTEHKRQQDAARQGKMRTVVSQAKKESEMYMQKVDKAKMISAMENKKKEAQQEKQQNKATESLARIQLEDLRSQFRQRNTLDDKAKSVKQTANLRLLEKAIRPDSEPPAKKRRTN